MIKIAATILSRRQAPRSGLSLLLAVTLLGGLLLLPPVLTGCSDKPIPTDSSSYPMDSRESQRAAREGRGSGSIFGKEGLILFGKKKEDAGANSGVAVNSFLWRASLDTLAFMPLSAADPFGGVIITDWYTPPESPDRRFKANAYILDRDLRADGIRVTLFQQRRDTNSSWIDTPVDEKTARDLEDAILTRARQLRVEQASR